jgi:hypothetical protein
MSLAFTVEARASAVTLALPLLAHCAAGFGIVLLTHRLLDFSQAAAVSSTLAGGLLLAWSMRRWSRPVQGRLAVDDAGRAHWTDLTGTGAREVVLLRWLPATGPVAWLRLQPLAGSALSERGAFDLILLRSQVGEERWRALHAWLVWYERGGPRRPPL